MGYCFLAAFLWVSAVHAAQPTTAPKSLPTHTVAIESLRVRSGPGTHFAHLRSLNKGTQVIAAQSPRADWLSVAGGGFVAKRFLTPIKLSSKTPRVFPKLTVQGETAAKIPKVRKNRAKKPDSSLITFGKPLQIAIVLFLGILGLFTVHLVMNRRLMSEPQDPVNLVNDVETVEPPPIEFGDEYALERAIKSGIRRLKAHEREQKDRFVFDFKQNEKLAERQKNHIEFNEIARRIQSPQIKAKALLKKPIRKEILLTEINGLLAKLDPQVAGLEILDSDQIQTLARVSNPAMSKYVIPHLPVEDRAIILGHMPAHRFTTLCDQIPEADAQKILNHLRSTCQQISTEKATATFEKVQELLERRHDKSTEQKTEVFLKDIADHFKNKRRQSNPTKASNSKQPKGKQPVNLGDDPFHLKAKQSPQSASIL